MGVIRGNFGQEIISKNTKIDISNCVELAFENQGSSTVTIGKYDLLAGKHVVFKTSNVVLNKQELEIKFSSSDLVDNKLYVQMTIATANCNCNSNVG